MRELNRYDQIEYNRLLILKHMPESFVEVIQNQIPECGIGTFIGGHGCGSTISDWALLSILDGHPDLEDAILDTKAELRFKCLLEAEQPEFYATLCLNALEWDDMNHETFLHLSEAETKALLSVFEPTIQNVQKDMKKIRHRR